jgi:membrane protease YdiL (CAAX protease family)
MRFFFVVLHRRPWRSFITARPHFDRRLFLRSFLAALLLWLGAQGVDFVLSPADLKPASNILDVALFAPVALLLLPFQCLAEEVLFRGYIAQAVGRLSGVFAVRLIIPALLFAAGHIGNPEWNHDQVWAGSSYLLLALYLGLISLRGGGIEASWGMHLANNIYAVLIVGSDASVSPGPSLWREHDPDFRASFFLSLVLVALHYLLLFRPFKRARG